MNSKFEIYICHDRQRDAARLLSSELRFRGYSVYCCYRKGMSLSNDILSGCRYVILVLSDVLFANAEFGDELKACCSAGVEVVPVCLSSDARRFPSIMKDEFADWRSLQVSVIYEDDFFEKSIDKLIEDRFAEDFKTGHRVMMQNQNGLSLNTLRLVDIVRKEGENLNDCLWRVFNCKMRESHLNDWCSLD